MSFFVNTLNHDKYLSAEEAVSKVIESTLHNHEMLNKESLHQRLKIHSAIVQRELSRIGGHDNYVVSAWRPLMGWGCAFILLYATLIQEILSFISIRIVGLETYFPTFSLDLPIELLITLLGMSNIHTICRYSEKIKFIAAQIKQF